ncbi:MAG TPA: histidinol-phosphatase [Clostridium sp.]|nr:histidinol-phosphatase [Clostridium sp.]
MNIDFHVHGLLSKRKDFNERFFIEEIEYARVSNLHGIVMCEHFNAINFKEIYKYLQENYKYEGDRYLVKGVSIFPAMEVSIKDKGHVVLVGNREAILEIHEKLKPHMDRENLIEFKSLLDLADEYGCLKIGAHPFRSGHKLCNHPEELLKRLDALDLNAKDIFKKGEEAKRELLELSSRIGINVITGSDSHTPLQLGGIYTELNSSCHTVEELRGAIVSASYSIKVQPSLDFRVYSSKILKRYLIARTDYDKDMEFTI